MDKNTNPTLHLLRYKALFCTQTAMTLPDRTFFAPWGVGWLVVFPADGSAASRALPLMVRAAIQFLNMLVVFMVSGFILKVVVGV